MCIFTAVDDWDAAMCESNVKMLPSFLGKSYSEAEKVLADAGKAEQHNYHDFEGLVH